MLFRSKFTCFPVTISTKATATKNPKLFSKRDRHGVRPLVLGKLERGWVVASETAALDIVGAAFVREIEPGDRPADCRRYEFLRLLVFC